MPTDEITVFLQPTGSLVDICKNFASFIYATIKQPLAFFPVTPGSLPIEQENSTVSAYFTPQKFFIIYSLC